MQRDPKEDTQGRRNTISYGTQLRLGIRNTFNLPAKFLLLLLVFLFVVSAVSSQYVSVKQQQDTVSEVGFNTYFSHYDPKRIVVEKQDRSPFTRADYEALENAPHVEKLIREDMIYDSQVYIENDQFSFYGYPLNISSLEDEITFGGLPQADDEVVLSGYDDGWTFGEEPEKLVGNTYTIYGDDGTERKVKVAGIVFKEFDEDDYYGEGEVYFSDAMVIEIRKSMYASRAATTMHINGSDIQLMPGAGGLVVNDNLAEHEGEVFINPQDYRRLYERGSYQASVFIDDTREMDGMVDMLERGGYHVLVLKDHLFNFMDGELISIISVPLAVIVCLAVFFIAYFVIRLILKSRGVYFATVRMLGMGRKPARRIMRVELVLVCLIAFAVFLLFIYLNYLGVIYREQLMNCILYLTTRDYILLAAILLVMAVLIAGRFMRSIFKSSAMGAYREEA